MRRAASSAPVSEPTAMNVPSRPYSLAPLSKTSVAISAEVIWKFRPKVPAKNTMRQDQHQVRPAADVADALADHARARAAAGSGGRSSVGVHAGAAARIGAA